jgi:epoxyqueuosine reductase
MENLRKVGYRACIVDSVHLAEVEKEYRAHTETQAWRSSPHLQGHTFDFQPPSWAAGNGTIIIVAAPVAPVRLEFTTGNRKIPVDAPPLSTDYLQDLVIFGSIIDSVLLPAGYRQTTADLPTKLIASHGGLLENGYNNMGFIAGMGSFFRLAAFYSDLPGEPEQWYPHEVSERCPDCGVCLAYCPTGCLKVGEYDVSRCLSLLSKEPFDFPDWVDKRWHNAVVGCRVCQLNCPQNHDIVNGSAVTESFDRTETEDILAGVPYDKLRIETRSKLERFHLSAYYGILPRNLRLLLTGEARETIG